jgi:chromate transport protein ChrA
MDRPFADLEAPGEVGRDRPSWRPLTRANWLLINLKIGLFFFGTGSVMPLYEKVLVQETAAMTPEEFLEVLTISQVLPGPSLVSMTMYLGARLFGFGAGVLGVLCMCVPGVIWGVLVLGAVPLDQPDVRKAFRGFAIGSCLLLLDLLNRLRPGLDASGTQGVRVGFPRVLRRLAVSVIVGGLLVAHVSMLSVVVLGVPACLAAEFLP